MSEAPENSPAKNNEVQPKGGPAVNPAPPPQFIEFRQEFSGPLPPPAVLYQYNYSVTDGANRIMRMAEIEGEHRRAMELAVVDKTFGESTRGQYCALVVALSGIGGAIYLGTLGMQWAASIVGGASLAVIVLAFLKAKASEPEPPPPPVPVNRKAKKK